MRTGRKEEGNVGSQQANKHTWGRRGFLNCLTACLIELVRWSVGKKKGVGCRFARRLPPFHSFPPHPQPETVESSTGYHDEDDDDDDDDGGRRRADPSLCYAMPRYAISSICSSCYQFFHPSCIYLSIYSISISISISVSSSTFFYIFILLIIIRTSSFLAELKRNGNKEHRTENRNGSKSKSKGKGRSSSNSMHGKFGVWHSLFFYFYFYFLLIHGLLFSNLVVFSFLC
ncbi:hypothetical protein F4778DRAFT_421961 [Xylariomycetidae sp. FL2044]|nr:hypothetical protein F4778DRAFT_421961 [Xylariomycetidae sp. FL2044]